MIHPIETVMTLVIVGALGALVWLNGPPLPQPKPEEFVVPPVEFIEPASQEQTATIRVQPTPEKTPTERVKELEERGRGLNAEQRALIERVKELTKEVKEK